MTARALDLYGCEGGVTRGLQRAGFHVTAVDNDLNRLKRNPAEVLVKDDAVEFALRYGHLFDFIWASPPCQDYTAGTRAVRAQGGVTGYPRLIEATRAALVASGVPWAIENVAGARAELQSPIVLCGGDFGLTATDDDGTTLHLQRHRLIETTLDVPGGKCDPYGCRYDKPGRQVAGVYGGARKDKHEARHVRHGGYAPASRRVQEELLGLTDCGMSLKGLQECVPPAFAEYVARAAIHHIEVAA
jgi:DNA (cytosine-5)-methyltransferase 1